PHLFTMSLHDALPILISFLKRKCWKHMVYMDDDHVCACPCCRGYIVCRCDSSIPGFSLFCTKLSDIFRRFHHPNGPLRCDRQPRSEEHTSELQSRFDL